MPSGYQMVLDAKIAAESFFDYTIKHPGCINEAGFKKVMNHGVCIRPPDASGIVHFIGVPYPSRTLSKII